MILSVMENDMATCLKHSQSYSPEAGEYCPYCGNPMVITSGSSSSKTSSCACMGNCPCHEAIRLHGAYFGDCFCGGANTTITTITGKIT